ncbi:S-layer protein domain-containing protein [Methanolapillus millepedarum]|uniref:S-layer protein n=1 Tax=Methanolapillus millepedarum TaxID=3028296 RepID=A0AA96V340_9EURY|nr:hypothetical protein MsAc7_11840 [Methanosarcinaceae archaeon Ac7]
MNKMIFKILIALLVLFAMASVASAAAPVITLGGVNNAGTDITWKWTGTAGEIYDVIISAGVSPVGTGTGVEGSTAGEFSYTFSGATVGTDYTINVTSRSVPADTTEKTNKILNIDDITSFKSTNSTTTDFEITWTGSGNLQTCVGDLSGATWTSQGSTPGSFTIAGNNASDNIINYRLNDSENLSAVKNITFKKITITDPTNKGTDFIEWNFTTISDWGSVDYKLNNTTAEVTNGSNDSGKINATGLTTSQTYTISIRGNNSTIGYGLWTSNGPVSLTATQLFPSDGAGTTNFNGAGNPSDITTEVGKELVVNATTVVNCSFVWTLNNSSNPSIKTESNATDNKTDAFKWTPTATGDYKLKLVVTEKANSSNTKELVWNIKVTEKSTGNRVWSDGMPTTYTWDARSFSGFYYNLDTGEGNESMTISNIGRSISKGDIKYVTTPSTTDYAYSKWGNYSVVGFMGDKYFAGYDSNNTMMKDGNLSKVLTDSDQKTNANMGQYIALEEGYSLKVDQIDLKGDKVRLVLEKNGKEVDSGFGSSNGTVAFNKSFSNKNYTIVQVHIGSVFQGTESSIVTIDGLFQISDSLTKLESGTKIDKMEISSVSSSQIEMTNHESVSLSSGSNVTLMGKMKIEVADSGTLRFAPYIEYTDPGKYEVRGTVSDFNNSGYIVSKWTPQNFEGFFYDIDDDNFNTESISVATDLNSTRTIAKGDLVYNSTVVTTDYNYSSWGKYDVVGFMGDKYFAGYNSSKSMLKDGYLSKVLVDNDDKRNANMGQYIALEEGYSLKVSQIDLNGNSVQLILEKNGKEVDSNITRSGNDATFEKKIGNENYTIVKVHVDSVFQGTESSIVSIRGLFQISDSPMKLDDSARYGKMEVSSHSSTGIELRNQDTVGLSSGNTVDFLTVGNTTMSFKVGDNSTLRYAPIVIREIGSNSSLEVKASPNPVTVGKAVNITVSDRGTTLEGATVIANGSTIGTTNSSGMISYTPNSVGTIKITATKAGYVDGSASLTVQAEAKNMSMSISPDEVYPGAAATIRVYDSLSGSNISGAKIYVGSDNVGTTDSGGQFNYTFNNSGTYTVLANATDYLNTTKTVSVVSKVNFVFSNFSLSPENLSAGKTTKLSFNITNNGIESGSHTVTLQLVDSTGNVVDEDSKTVSLDVGKSKDVTLSVKPKTEGTYTLVLKEDNNVVSNLPSNMGTISVGPSSGLSTAVYAVIAVVGIIVLAILGYLGYLFGVKGATRSNYKDVSRQVTSDLKGKFKRNK